MKPFTLLFPIFWYAHLHLLLLLFTLKNSTWHGPNRTVALALENQTTDHLSLLSFKGSISNDPYGVLVSWNSSTHLCNWHGITCSPMHRRVAELNLERCQLHGSISPHTGNLSFLTNLNLAGNSFFGKIPQELGRLFRLQQLYLNNNSFFGEIPTNLTNCSSLKYLNLKRNNLTGKIPIEIASLQNLEVVNVMRNKLIGGIPPFIGNLSSLTDLGAGDNNFEGGIPREICRLKNLTGEVPTEGVFGNANELTVMGNNKLCGGISELHLPSCLVKGMKPAKHHNFRLIAVIVSVVALLLILLFFLSIYWIRKRIEKPSTDVPTIDQLAKVSYQDLHQGTNGFSIGNLIGSGSFGSVYKGTLESVGGVVAIKILNLQKKGAHKSFIAECNALRSIRHRNLVKILTCCSSTDYKGHDFKALIFEYMKNGSLDSWLHPTTETTDQPKSINLEQRLNVIADVASAFHYLHYECDPLVIHCDLKPSNILLDDCLVAHVSDFGLARLLSSVGVSLMLSSTSGIQGTIGYAPPEYGMGTEVSIEGDMYSFGVLILEMLTGRRPTDKMFKDGHNLHNYVKHSIPDHFLQIVDPTILPSGLEHNTYRGNLGNMHPNVEKCLLLLLRIALACSVESPKDRMSMVDVTRELNIIKSFFPTSV